MSIQKPILDYVLTELSSRKGTWPTIAKEMRPAAPDSYYSWMTKLAQGRIPDPGVNGIQELADYFRSHRAAA